MSDARPPQPSVSRDLARATRGRGTQDVIGFRRIFILYCSLVLAPALLMSGFAVSAIVNERAADKQRRHDRAASVLRAAEARLGQVLADTDRTARGAFDVDAARAGTLLTEARQQGAPIGAYLLFGPDQQVLAASGVFRAPKNAVDGALEGAAGGTAGAAVEAQRAPPLLARLQDLSTRAAPNSAAHALIDDPQFDGVISLQKHTNGRALIYALDEERLSVAIAAATEDPEMRVQLAVVPRNAALITNAVERLMDDLVRARSEN